MPAWEVSMNWLASMENPLLTNTGPLALTPKRSPVSEHTSAWVDMFSTLEAAVQALDKASKMSALALATILDELAQDIYLKTLGKLSH